MAEFYDWQKTLSYDADVTMVVGARGIGKTYGIRKQCIKDYIKDGTRFVEISRYAAELEGEDSIQHGYFERLAEDEAFSNYIFKTHGKSAYIAKRVGADEKPKWERIGYFVALTQSQQAKRRTFSKVKRIIFDEAVLERHVDRYHGYLPGEYEKLASVVDTVSRERADTDGIRPRLYLLGNAADLLNPIFIRYGIGDEPKRGYSWHGGKTMLLHYPEAGEYGKEKASGTVAGRMLAGSDEHTNINVENIFRRHDAEFFAIKPKRAKFSFGIYFKNRKYGVWLDLQDGYYYIDNKIPNNAQPVFTLTAEDSRPNYIMASRMQKSLKGFVDLYYMGVCRYNNESTRDGFIQALMLFGVR